MLNKVMNVNKNYKTKFVNTTQDKTTFSLVQAQMIDDVFSNIGTLTMTCGSQINVFEFLYFPIDIEDMVDQLNVLISNIGTQMSSLGLWQQVNGVLKFTSNAVNYIPEFDTTGNVTYFSGINDSYQIVSTPQLTFQNKISMVDTYVPSATTLTSSSQNMNGSALVYCWTDCPTSTVAPIVKFNGTVIPFVDKTTQGTIQMWSFISGQINNTTSTFTFEVPAYGVIFFYSVYQIVGYSSYNNIETYGYRQLQGYLQHPASTLQYVAIDALYLMSDPKDNRTFISPSLPCSIIYNHNVAVNWSSFGTIRSGTAQLMNFTRTASFVYQSTQFLTKVVSVATFQKPQTLDLKYLQLKCKQMTSQMILDKHLLCVFCKNNNIFVDKYLSLDLETQNQILEFELYDDQDRPFSLITYFLEFIVK